MELRQTRTRPHMPEQLPPLSVLWIVQRNLKIPRCRNLLETDVPGCSCLLYDQPPPYAVTV